MFPYLAVLVNAIGWSLKSVFEKKAVEAIGVANFTFTRYIMMGIITLVLYLIYLYIMKIPKEHVLNKQFIRDNVYWSIIISFFALIAIYAHYYLLKTHDAYWVIAIVESSIVIFTTLFSIVILKEKLNMAQCWGILLIALGIYFINLKN